MTLSYPGEEYFSKSSLISWTFLVVIIYFLYRMFSGKPVISYGNLQSSRNPRAEGEYSSMWPYISVYAHEPGTNEYVQAANATFIPRMGHPNGQEYVPTQPYVIQTPDFHDGPEPPHGTTQSFYHFINNFPRNQGVAWLKKKRFPGNAA